MFFIGISGRGAELRNWSDFRKYFERFKTNEVTLHHNYRSTHNIIDAASALIANNEYRIQKKMTTSKSNFLHSNNIFLSQSRRK